jgi:tetratricopeptide (TPR) repeat protein
MHDAGERLRRLLAAGVGTAADSDGGRSDSDDGTGDGGRHGVRSARWFLDRAYERSFAEDPRGAIRNAELGIAAAGNDVGIQVRLLGILIAVQANDGAEDAALDSLRRRLELLRTAGLELQADVESRLGLLLFREATEAELPRLTAELERLDAIGHRDGPEHRNAITADVCSAIAVVHEEAGRSAEALPLLQRAVQLYRASNHADGVAGSLMYLAHCLVELDREEEALDISGQLLAMDLNRALRASVLLQRAKLGLGAPSRSEAAGADALDALELYLATGIRTGAIAACTLMAQLLVGAGRHADAAAALRIAVDQAERGEHPVLAPLKLNLGKALLEAEDYAAAAQVLAEVLLLQRRSGTDGLELADTLASLGRAHRHSEDHAGALHAWQEANRLFRSAGAHSESARMLLALGTLLAEDGRQQEAIAAFRAAVDTARKAQDNPAALPESLHTLGYALCEAGDPEGLDRLDEAIGLARSYGAAWFAADFTDSRARGLWVLGHGEQAVAAALNAADLYAAAGDVPAAGNAELFAARVLTGLDRARDAVPIFRNALDHTGDQQALGIAVNLELADALDTLGRTAEAEAARAAANELDHRNDDGAGGAASG